MKNSLRNVSGRGRQKPVVGCVQDRKPETEACNVWRRNEATSQSGEGGRGHHQSESLTRTIWQGASGLIADEFAAEGPAGERDDEVGVAEQQWQAAGIAEEKKRRERERTRTKREARGTKAQILSARCHAVSSRELNSMSKTPELKT